jgi:hypothetical protein
MTTTAGQLNMGCQNNFLLKIQHHPSNILSSASFTPPPRKGWIQKIIDILTQEGRP